MVDVDHVWPQGFDQPGDLLPALEELDELTKENAWRGRCLGSIDGDWAEFDAMPDGFVT
jgi:hypothetical protein